MGAPEGNTNSKAENRLWGNTIRRAIAQSDPDKLRRIADKMLALAEGGEQWAVKELGDRLDGKPSQSLDIGSDPDRPMVTKIVREIVHPPNQDG